MNDAKRDLIDRWNGPSRILILSDDKATLDALHIALKHPDLDVHIAYLSQDLLQTISAHAPEAVIIDLLDSDLTNHEIIKRLRTSDDASDLPIYFVSAANDWRSQLSAAQSGADGILAKPFHPELIITIIKARATRFRQNKLLQRDVDQLVTRLNRTAQDALAASQAKAQFIASVSHELRTPLNGILGMSDILAEESLSETAREAAEVIRNSSHLLLDLINDVLDFSKIEAGQIEINAAPITIKELIREIVHLHSHRAKQKNLTLVAKLSAHIGCFRGDRVKILQIMNNLIGNAIKFTDQGQIQLEIDHRTLQERGDILEFHVRDTGIGVASEDAERIFQAFIQGKNYATRSTSGTGLGLAISRRLARAMGGDVLLEQASPEGSWFMFYLPLTLKEANREIVPSPSSGDQPVLSGAYDVLVVDDNEINRIVAGRLLTSLGCRAHFAHDGESALIALRSRRFDLILMDCHMPDPNGFAVTRIIRNELGPNQQTTIMAVTASAFSEDRTLCLSAGMDAYIAKPITRAALQEALHTITRNADSNMND